MIKYVKIGYIYVVEIITNVNFKENTNNINNIF